MQGLAGAVSSMAACRKSKRKAGISPGSRLFSVVEDTQAFTTNANLFGSNHFTGVIVLVEYTIVYIVG
jgi:hypothetical protein